MPPVYQANAGRIPPFWAVLPAYLWFFVPGIILRCGVPRPPSVRILEDYFSEKKIIKKIIRIRISIAKKRHDEHFLFNLNKDFPNPSDFARQPIYYETVCSMMPPRRMRPRGRPRELVRDKISANKIVELSIECTINQAIATNQDVAWLNNLKDFVRDIQNVMRRIRTIDFNPPYLSFVVKSLEDKTYRPIATFRLDDRIIIGVCAEVLRDILDPLLLPYSYAFRGRQKDIGRSPNHHDAVRALLHYMAKNKGKSLYVAECDIQKFYDSVNHGIAKKELNALLRTARKQKMFYDKRILKVFNAYLRAYNFQEQVLPTFKLKGKEGSVPWVEKAIAGYYCDRIPSDIGVPQGGALSPLIANVVLHSADAAVHERAKRYPHRDFFYARYCDDMIIISSDEELTKDLFSTYLDQLRELKLPFHKPENISKFSADFFDMKSRNTYSFGSPKNGAVSPWISFLGYQIRYDGRLRIRKSSWKKEISKQSEVFLNTIRAIGHKNILRVGWKRALHRARLRMIAMSVGAVSIISHGSELKHEMCWISGFQLLKEFPYVRSQVRFMDRMRTKFLIRLKWRLKKSAIKYQDGKGEKKALEFYGKPFSYDAQFQKRIRAPHKN